MKKYTIDDDVTMPGMRMMLVGRYKILRQLGQGGMGSVWLAEDTQLDGKLFAIKMLPSILVANKRAYIQLKAEALVSMKLSHPNIVTLRAFEENDGNPFLVMDYVDGVTLDEYLAEMMVCGGVGAPGVCALPGKGPGGGVGAPGVCALPGKGPGGGGGAPGVCALPGKGPGGGVGRARTPAAPDGASQSALTESEVVSLLRPIAEALDYAHREGVVHRDVKPSNVMIRKDGHPFILDFGIAREIQETMTRVTGKLSSGTLLYMSPEQLNGDGPKASQDVYSFAAMVYECLTGHPPFYRGAIEDQIKNKEPEPIGRAWTPAVPGNGNGASGVCARPSPSIAESVMAGLSKKPGDRPETCVSVLRHDDSVHVGKPVRNTLRTPFSLPARMRATKAEDRKIFARRFLIGFFIVLAGISLLMIYVEDEIRRAKERGRIEYRMEKEHEERMRVLNQSYVPRPYIPQPYVPAGSLW